ncbi:MAG TPA: CbiX/SirB N-terminal domain-containing protein [Acidobacteriota bacterium]|nr:CbiX/SirB N-terminal domain-containing protein [Acidobacteriota bacterium]
MRSSAPSHALILAAHGSRRRKEANRIVRDHAVRLQRDFGYPRVQAAFWQGRPGFGEVLDRTPAERYTVLPLFTADGYYVRRVLPRELAGNRRYQKERVRITAPLGLRPEVLHMAEERSRILLRDFGLSGLRSTLIVIGHGTRRHARSRTSTLKLVKRLQDQETFSQVLPAFLDDSPGLPEAFAQAGGEAVILLPFLIGGTFHALHDIPRTLGLRNGQRAHRGSGHPLPSALLQGDRLLIFDRALGEDPSVAAVLDRMARSDVEGTLPGFLPPHLQAEGANRHA